MTHVVDPFAQANAAWLGLGDDGHRRKVFKVADQHINTGREPLWLIFIYDPHGNLPRT